jgi:hypothetical protein
MRKLRSFDEIILGRGQSKLLPEWTNRNVSPIKGKKAARSRLVPLQPLSDPPTATAAGVVKYFYASCAFAG